MPDIQVDEPALRAAGGQALPNCQGISIAGWTIEARNAPITRDADMDAYREHTGGAMHLPEQLFGDSFLQLSHEATGLQLGFRAVDALRQWNAEPVPAVQVAHARKWQQSREADMKANNVLTLDYDWNARSVPASYFDSLRTPLTWGSTERAKELAVQDFHYVIFRKRDDTARRAGWALRPDWRASEKPMDKSVLTQRDAILFFADIPLYESELDDNGASSLSVKIRVMPGCWFVLLRFWLRVDGLMVRLRDTRILCRWPNGAPQLVRELLHAEGTFEDLAAAGAPTNANAYRTAQTTADVLQAVAPVGCSLFKTEVLETHCVRVE